MGVGGVVSFACASDKDVPTRSKRSMLSRDSPVAIRENSIQFSMEREFCEFSPELEDHFEVFEHIRGFNVTIVTSANTQDETLPPSFDGHKEIVLVAQTNRTRVSSAAGPQARAQRSQIFYQGKGGLTFAFPDAESSYSNDAMLMEQDKFSDDMDPQEMSENLQLLRGRTLFPLGGKRRIRGENSCSDRTNGSGPLFIPEEFHNRILSILENPMYISGKGDAGTDKGRLESGSVGRGASSDLEHAGDGSNRPESKTLSPPSSSSKRNSSSIISNNNQMVPIPRKPSSTRNRSRSPDRSPISPDSINMKGGSIQRNGTTNGGNQDSKGHNRDTRYRAVLNEARNRSDGVQLAVPANGLPQDGDALPEYPFTMEVSHCPGLGNHLLQTSNYPGNIYIQILMWNCRSAANNRFRRVFMELIRGHRPLVVFIVETRISGSERAEPLGFGAKGTRFTVPSSPLARASPLDSSRASPWRLLCSSPRPLPSPLPSAFSSSPASPAASVSECSCRDVLKSLQLAPRFASARRLSLPERLELTPRLLAVCPVPTKAQTLLTHYWTILRAGETIPLQIYGLTNLLTDERSEEGSLLRTEEEGVRTTSPRALRSTGRAWGAAVEASERRRVVERFVFIDAYMIECEWDEAEFSIDPGHTFIPSWDSLEAAANSLSEDKNSPLIARNRTAFSSLTNSTGREPACRGLLNTRGFLSASFHR
ncbi:hypothetical protein ZIOFF_075112 [Zingiber officinale]|uniref:Uncharacterized protein n=1 Tax=Zingiber officinale TaxID=94328 RepID=A0A8J5ERP3_ZINOF|nr:hypothetical protein ZIOFF_075112 [Zingiber officinale]